MYAIKCDVYFLNKCDKSFTIRLPFVPRKGEYLCVDAQDAVFTVLDVVYHIQQEHEYDIMLHVEEN